MPTPNDFHAVAPASTDESRRMVWASLTPAQIHRKLEDDAASQHAEWMQSLLDMGGLSLPLQVEQYGQMAEELSQPALTLCGLRRHEAIAGIVRIAQLETVNAWSGDYVPGSPLYAHINVLPVAAEFKAFHGAYCQQLADESAARIASWSGPQEASPVEYSHAVRAIVETVAVALATAAILDNSDSVALLASTWPDAMLVCMAPRILGPSALTEVASNEKPPTVNPFLCALQFSSENSIHALIEAGFPDSMPLGKDNTYPHAAPLLFHVDSFASVITPRCEPELYAKVLRIWLEHATPEAAVELTENATAALRIDPTEPADACNYLPALMHAGVFDAAANEVLTNACRSGNLAMVMYLLDKVDWPTLMSSFATMNSPITAALQCAAVSDERETCFECCKAIYNAAVKAGYPEALTAWCANRSQGDKYRLTQEPMHLMVVNGATELLQIVINAGFDARAIPEGCSQSLLTTAQSYQPHVAQFIASLSAHRQAHQLLVSLPSANHPSGGVRP